MAGDFFNLQGPPGSGKSYTASHLIAKLAKDGKRIGVTALSHKVISNLLTKISEAATEINFEIKMIQKVKDESPNKK